MHATYIHPITSFSKRTLDICVAIIALTIFLPFLPFILFAIKYQSPGPIIYKQIRIGQIYNNYVSIFTLYKFRTMSLDAEKHTGPILAKKNDPRITAFGRFLRKTRIDEIPQMWNVIKGDMSIVGPRPERPVLCGKLEKRIPLYIERTHDVAPGITGLAQVNMSYDDTTENIDAKVSLDHAYALSLSYPLKWLKTDLLIMLKTVLVMINGKG